MQSCRDRQPLPLLSLEPAKLRQKKLRLCPVDKKLASARWLVANILAARAHVHRVRHLVRGTIVRKPQTDLRAPQLDIPEQLYAACLGHLAKRMEFGAGDC